MHGYQIKLLWEKLIEIHGLILSQNWIQLKRVAVISDETIEEAKIEIEAYPGSMTECPYDEFTDAVTINSFDGRNAIVWHTSGLMTRKAIYQWTVQPNSMAER